jgi:hypothetical protein
MSPATQLMIDMVLQATVIFLFLGSLFSMVFGVSLFLRHRWVFRLNERMTGWISTRQALRPLDTHRNLEAYVYRQNRWAGIVIAVASLFVLYVAVFDFDARALAHLFGARTLLWVQMVLEAVWWMIVAGCLAGLVVGLMLAASPEKLRAADAWINRRYSIRRATKPLDIMHVAPDQWIAARPQLSGAVITVGSVYVALVLGYFLASRI